MIISAKNCWDKALAHHAGYFDTKVIRGLSENGVYLNGRLRIFIDSHFEAIRDGGVLELYGLTRIFDTIINSLDPVYEKEQNLAVLRDIFDYDAFSKKKRREWCAYKLCASSEILTCPYCNLSFAHVVFKDKDGKIRPALDHYYDKVRYPFLSISINNLVPSCHLCNSSLKATVDFQKSRHLHPLFNKESINIGLDVDIKSRWDINQLKCAKIKIEPFRNAKLASRSVATFILEERYAMIESEARHIAEGMIVGSSRSQLPGSVDVLQWVMRGVDKINYRNRIMGKMILDLKDQFVR